MTSKSLVCISLFDSTGTWAAFAPPGATVYAVDLEPKPLEWSNARGVRHIQGDVRVVAWSVGLVFLLAGRAPRADVLLMAPPPARRSPVSDTSREGRAGAPALALRA